MTADLHIFAILNKNIATSQEDAQKLFPQLETAVKNEQKIVLSFDGMENCTTIFLNNLLGKLYLSFGDKVDHYVHFEGIQKDDLILPHRLERLRRRALSPEVYQPIFDSAFGQA